jgi:Mce-associated membrane protein
MSKEAVLEAETTDAGSAWAPRDDADDGTASGPEVREERPRTRERRRFLVIEAVSLVLIVGLAAALILSQVQLSNQNSLNADRASAITAAKVYATNVASYNYRHLHRDFGRVENESTEPFRSDFRQSSDSLSKVLVQYQAVATATVVRAGIESITSSQAVVLLFVDQSVKNTAQGTSTDTNRIAVTLVRGGNGWLMKDLKIL